MSEYADDTINRYVDLQPGLKDALLTDPVQQAQIETLRQTLTAVERALADEGLSGDVQRRVINRMVWGHPDGFNDPRAKFSELRKQMLALDLPSDTARAWWTLDVMNPEGPDGPSA